MEGHAQAPFQLLPVNWFTEVADDPFLESARARGGIGIGRYQDSRYRVPHLDEAPVELNSRHRRHIDICDQASGFDESR